VIVKTIDRMMTADTYLRIRLLKALASCIAWL